MTYIGIDLHATNMVIVAINGNGDLVKQAKIASCPKALDEFFDSIQKPVTRFYRKVKRRSGVKVARTVVAKELAKIVWHMLSKDQPYKGFKGRPTRTATQSYWPQPISPFA